MNQKLVARPLLRTLVALAALNATGFVGCGSDISSQPNLEISDAGGDIPLIPSKDPRKDNVARPNGFQGQAVPDCVRLSWDMPAPGYTAILHCDGLHVATVDAQTFQYDDMSPKAPGTYLYTIRFSRGTTVSEQVERSVTIGPAQVLKDSDGSSLDDL